ncbi:hypothetical protein LWC33_29515 [Pseudonocardia sp. RS11V-5]|uniref:hypothetical protein n=1 Tax=Pseudonocardia terrae TaxID=2905831 RepID=UPI001E3BF189|nr:hypothetical protein [Pseudonocardia terrae]MCE3555570.1 hypothetical protein [Pseudonocardia terrae]
MINPTRRRTEEEDAGAPVPGWPLDAPTVGRAMQRKPRQFDRYAWVAWVMLIGAVAGGALWGAGVISLFWLEIFVALLSAVFWIVQNRRATAAPAAETGNHHRHHNILVDPLPLARLTNPRAPETGPQLPRPTVD